MSLAGMVVLAAPATPPRTPAVAAMLAWVLAVPLYFAANFAGTVAHEGGHALIGKLLFRGIKAIRFYRYGGGVTQFNDLPRLVAIPVFAAGYLGPSMFGLFGAWLLRHGEVDAVLWGSLAFLAVMLVVVRGPVGWLLVPALFVALLLIAIQAHGPLRVLWAYLWVWLLLIVGVEDMFAYMRGHGYDDPGSDAGQLKRLTLLPSALWAVVLLAGTVAALVLGGRLLLTAS